MENKALSKKVLTSLLAMSCVYLGGTFALPTTEAATLVTSADQNITLPSTGDKTQEFSDINKVYSGINRWFICLMPQVTRIGKLFLAAPVR